MSWQYEWAPGARIGIKAQPAGERIDYLREKKGSALQAEDVLKDAVRKRSPLHDHFEWDDGTAANLYRLEQARLLLRSIVRCKVTEDDKVTRKAWVYISGGEEEEDEGGYEDLDVAMKDSVLRQHVLNAAEREMVSFKRKYDGLVELAAVFDAMTSFKKRRHRKKKR